MVSHSDLQHTVISDQSLFRCKTKAKTVPHIRSLNLDYIDTNFDPSTADSF